MLGPCTLLDKLLKEAVLPQLRKCPNVIGFDYDNTLGLFYMTVERPLGWSSMGFRATHTQISRDREERIGRKSLGLGWKLAGEGVREGATLVEPVDDPGRPLDHLHVIDGRGNTVHLFFLSVERE